MWVRMAIGAVAGLAAGHFLATGYALWIVLGVTGGYAAEVWRVRRRARRAVPPET